MFNLFKKQPKEPELFETPGVFQTGKVSLDKTSRTWLFIEKYLNEQLQSAREDNDSMNKDVLQTAAIRGKIKFIKELLALPNEKPAKKQSITEYDY